LLLRADGAPWRPRFADHRLAFVQAVRAGKLPAGTTLYSLRHSSIARALLRGVPVAITSRWHDTSPAIIEAHYGRFIKHHYDDLVRAALLDTTPASAAIVPLRRA
jgi:hypothetical protein